MDLEFIMKKYYITTPIYYVNNPPHIGHAYTTLAADVLARYFRLKKYQVMFLTGTDEHGQKVAQSARDKNTSPQKYTDLISGKYKKIWRHLGIGYDKFIRTTDHQHIKKVQVILQKLYDKKLIYQGEYQGLYCVGCEEYKGKRDLKKGKCPVHKKKPEIIKESCYLFKLSKYQNKLLDLIRNNKFQIKPEARRNEIISFLKNEKLEDVAISRQKSKVSWGIELPFDKSHTTYVWIDALLNYLTAIDWPDDNFKKFWPPDLQLMAKDILRIHSTIWPALLMALDLPLPKKIFAHGFFTVNGHKMSKSLKNIIDPKIVLKDYGSDAIRYFLFREFHFGSDGDFSIDRFQERYRADLANDLGNLVQRVLKMKQKYKVETIKETDQALSGIEKDIEDLAFKNALDKIWDIVMSTNQEINQEEPWNLVKTDSEKLVKLLNKWVKRILVIANALEPLLPETSKNIIKQFQELKPEVLFPKV